MNLYKRSSLFYNALKIFTSKLFSNNQIQPTTPRINLSKRISCFDGLQSHGVIGSFSISSKLGFLSGFKFDQSSLFSGFSRRCYHVDSNNVHHFKQRGYRTWVKNRKKLSIFGFGGVLCGIMYYENCEVVPYTKRKHLVLMSRKFERKMGEYVFDEVKKSFSRKILPPLHPESIRVRLIAKDVIKALERGLGDERVWSDVGYASEGIGWGKSDGNGSLKAVRDVPKGRVHWEEDGLREVLDDSWVIESRKRGGKVSTRHLDGMKWEVLVVDEPVVNAFCVPGGKIVIYTGMLKKLKSDVEVATVIGHEVGHVVARHSAEEITKGVWLLAFELFLHLLFVPRAVVAMPYLLLEFPSSRRMEMEADYIGLLLTASAGYDPREAPRVYEKLRSEELPIEEYLSTHPSGKTRSQLLAQAQVMDEAFSLYREAISGSRIQGFL
ncbi:hypothetical protein vseg_001206 [Gypsophila vaccaria]